MRKFATLLVLLAVCSGLSAQHTLSGYIFDAATQEELIGATLFDQRSGKGTATNVFGFFSFSPENDTLDLRISSVGYQTQYLQVILSESVRKSFTLEPVSQELEAVEVSGDRFRVEEEVRSLDMGVFNLTPKEALSLPTIVGESDILKVAQLMPGITKGGEATTALYVRGGTDDQNLVTLDDATVYNLSHLFGFFSVFNTDALKNIKIVKGGFTADYGGRLSAVMDTRMQEGNQEKFEGKGGIGLLTSRLTLDGPMFNKKGTFMLAGRRTYIDQVLGAVGVELPYFFYDLNAKASYKISDRDRIYLSSYFGQDVLELQESTEAEDEEIADLTFGFKLGNFTTSLRWNHIYKNEKLFANFTLLQTQFKYDIGGDFVDNTLLIRSQIQDIGLKGQWEYFRSPDDRIDFGVDAVLHLFRPNVVNTSGDISDFLRSRRGNLIQTQEAAIYAGRENKLTSRLTTYYGLRVSSAFVQSAAYVGLEPRLNINYKLRELLSVKASYSLMRQYMHRVSSSSVILPTDLWYPVTAKVKPQNAHQWSTGIFTGLPNQDISLSLEGYYKRFNQLIEYREGARLLLNDNFEDELVTGTGESYGAEFLIRKRTGKLNGWIAYTISKATRTFDDLNRGQTFPARFDRRHDLSLVGTYDLSDRVAVSWVWVYTSGSNFTAQTGQYLAPGATVNDLIVVPVYTERNAIRLSPTHRLDLNFILRSKPKKKFNSEWQFSVYNFYNRAAPYRIDVQFDGRAFQYVQPGIFGFLPSISYNFSF